MPRATHPYLKIDGRMVYLWRTIDAEGEVLDVLVQSKRNKHAALKLMRKLLKKYAFVPERMITDDLRSYGAAARELGIENRHERGRWKNNRAEGAVMSGRRPLIKGYFLALRWSWVRSCLRPSCAENGVRWP
jgi:putative transposase